MQPMYYIGLDVHKRKISYCVKDGSGRIHAEGSISATRLELDHWMRSLPQPWSAAMGSGVASSGSAAASEARSTASWASCALPPGKWW